MKTRIPSTVCLHAMYTLTRKGAMTGYVMLLLGVFGGLGCVIYAFFPGCHLSKARELLGGTLLEYPLDARECPVLK